MPSNAISGTVQSPIYRNRRFMRRKLDVRVRLLARENRERPARVVYARTLDLSRGGACVTLSDDLPLGTEVLLCLRVPECSQPLCLKSVIIRRRGFRAGLKFLEPTAEERLLLWDFCDA